MFNYTIKRRGTLEFNIRKENFMQPKISVIVPAFNAGKYLYNCVTSIENQTYQNLEIIIINDGSTDDTGDIIDRLMSEYDNIVTFNTGNKDICVTRNAGLRMVSGEFFSFVDSDDRIAPDLIQVLMNTMNETNAEVVGCSFTKWSTEDEWAKLLTSSQDMTYGYTTYSPVDFLNKEVFTKGNSRCWSKLYKTSVIGDLSFDEETVIGEDLLFLIKLLRQINTIVEVDYKGYGYYQNQSGAMLRPFTPRYMANIDCWKKVRSEAAKLDETTIPMSSMDLLTAIMLTAGKLAELDRTKQIEYTEYIKSTHALLKTEMRTKDGYNLLSKRYKIKCMLFLKCPKLYLFVYHFHKYK